MEIKIQGIQLGKSRMAAQAIEAFLETGKTVLVAKTTHMEKMRRVRHLTRIETIPYPRSNNP